jgi:hypothetical protein
MRRSAKLLLVVAIAWTTTSPASECYAIQDADRRNACLASAENDQYHCFKIRDADLREACLAPLQGRDVRVLQDPGCRRPRGLPGRDEEGIMGLLQGPAGGSAERLPREGRRRPESLLQDPARGPAEGLPRKRAALNADVDAGDVPRLRGRPSADSSHTSQEGSRAARQWSSPR